MTRTIADALPSSYRGWLPPFFEQPLQEERYATCDNCAMCAPAQAPQSAPLLGALTFSPSTKCCTYHPTLPNFSVGGALADDSPEMADGGSRLRRKISERAGVLPIGIIAPQHHRYLYRHAKNLFGRSSELLCPYFRTDDGACTVWPYREGVAATYFCKHNDGESGRQFWMALLAWLREVEQALTHWTLLELDWPADHLLWLGGELAETDHLEAWQAAGEPPPDAVYGRWWRDWVGREEELYRLCHARVAGLDHDAISRMVGVSYDTHLRVLESRYRALVDGEIPDPLCVSASLTMQPTGDGHFLVTGYSQTDPLRLRSAVFEALHAFDGRRSNVEVLAGLEESGTRISTGLLRALVHHRLLIPTGRDPWTVTLGRAARSVDPQRS